MSSPRLVLGPDELETLVRFVNLSPRLKQVAMLIAYGKGRRDIAVELGLGIDTVREYLNRIYSAFGLWGVTSRTVLALRLRDLALGIGSPTTRPIARRSKD